MSMHRLVSCRKLVVSTRHARSSIKTSWHFVRWQSGSASPKRGGALKKILAGLAVTGVAAGGMLVYGNYDPAFKNQVNDKIPGFASWTDKAADLWVDMTDYFNPKSGDRQKSKDFVYEYNQAKVRQSELKKEDPEKPTSKAPTPKAPEIKPGSTEPAVKEGKVTGKGDEKNEDTVGKTTDTKPKQDKDVKRKSGKKEDSISSTKPVSPSKPSPEAATPPQADPPTPASPSPSPTPPQAAPPTPASPSPTPPQPMDLQTKPEDTTRRESLEQLEREGANTITDKKTEKQTKTLPAVGSEDVLPDTAQVEVMLDRTYKKFKSDADRVIEAQKGVMGARRDLLHALAKDTADKDKAVADAKTMVSSAQHKLVAATEDYNATSLQLKELVLRAPEEGCKAQTTDAIIDDIQNQEAELSLGRLLVMAVTAGADLLEGSMDSYQENKEKIQKDLAAAATLISEDGALGKRAESLENQLKAAELEHARYVMLALEVQRRSLEQLAEQKLEEVVKETQTAYQRQLIQEINKLADSYSAMLKQQLQLESESHAKELSEALKDQADKLVSAWSSKMDLKLSEQQGFYQTELAKARARLYGLEGMVEGIISAGEKTVQLQSLRNSCDILTSALDRVNVDSDATDRFTIGTELDALYRVASEEPFITTVLNSIPAQAISGAGIQSEASLKERFSKVKRICRRVSLVPETGGGLGLYAVSYLQSVFTIRVPLWMSKGPTEKEPSELHINDLLDLADARIKKGDLTGAVYYLNFLQGEPRNIARDWLKDARLYLETRQALELVQAYMFASGAITNQ